MKPQPSQGSPRRAAVVGVVAVTLTVGATGAAYALASNVRPTAEITAGDAAPPAPVDDAALRTGEPTPTATATATDDPAADGLAGADEYTQVRSDAFWDAGYYMEDAFALATLWHVDVLEAKGRAGQLLLDGQPVPVAPGSTLDLTDPATIEQLQLGAFWDAGYTGDDGVVLAALWHVDVIEAKSAAGQLLRDGQPVPISPSGTPAS